jgi:hypothetical protein
MSFPETEAASFRDAELVWNHCVQVHIKSNIDRNRHYQADHGERGTDFEQLIGDASSKVVKQNNAKRKVRHDVSQLDPLEVTCLR